MFSVAAGSIILRAVKDDQRARAQSLYNSSFLVGMMAGPVIGGFLTAISLRAPLLVYAALLVVASTELRSKNPPAALATTSNAGLLMRQLAASV